MDVQRALRASLAFGLLCGAQAAASVTITRQDFEAATADTWGFVASPAVYNTQSGPIVSGSNDVWAPIQAFSGKIDAAPSGTRFWGIQDIDNANASGEHRLVFDPLDLRQWTDLILHLSYRVVGFDSNDRLAYRVNGDEIPLFSGGVGGRSSAGWQRLQLSLNAIDTLNFELLAEQNGGSDFAGFDALRLEGNAVRLQALSAPSVQWLALTLLPAAIGFGQRRSPQSGT